MADPPPEGIEDRSGDEHIRALALRPYSFNTLLVITIPFWAMMILFAVFGLRDGVHRGSGGVVLLGLGCAVVVILLAWPIASVLFGRELVTLDRDQLSWRRSVGRFGFTRSVPLIGIATLSVQNLGFSFEINPTSVGWCLIIVTHRPYPTIRVGGGFMYDEQTVRWLKEHLRTGLAAISEMDD